MDWKNFGFHQANGIQMHEIMIEQKGGIDKNVMHLGILIEVLLLLFFLSDLDDMVDSV